MANRTMLIAANKVPTDQSGEGLETIGLSEFNYDIPLIYRVLVSVKPQLCHSTVFEMDEPIAIAGDAKAGLKLLTKLRDKLPKGAENLDPINQVIEFLSKAHHDYPYYILEPAEVFSMSNDPLGPQTKDLLREIKKLNMRHVKRTAAGKLNYPDWATDCWTNVLYFVPRGAVKPPVQLDKSYLSLTTKEVLENADGIANTQTLENLSLKTFVDDPDLDAALKLLAKVGPAFQLNITGKAHSLPDSISGLTGLSGVSFGNLGLKTLPNGLQSLTQLKRLYLAKNALTELPDGLRKLTQLKEINVSDNELTALPDWIGEFDGLNELNIMSNPIAAIPETLWKMTRLTKLYLGHTKLTSLPEAIGGLTNLASFNAQNLGLSKLPDSFWGLSALAGVTLNGNPFGPSLPDDFAKLKKLNNVNFYDCGLQVFPKSFCDLPELVRIDLRKNDISEVPDCILKKPLDWIGLQGNPHSHTRDEFNAKAIGL